jgi:hypothetical protein
METRDQGVVRVPPGEGETFWVLGDFVAFKADGESTGLSVFEGLVPLRTSTTSKKRRSMFWKAPFRFSAVTRQSMPSPVLSCGFREERFTRSRIRVQKAAGFWWLARYQVRTSASSERLGCL